MHVDFLTLACLRDELDRFVDGRAQQAMMLDDLSVGLELYSHEAGRKYLVLSAQAQYARALMMAEKVRRGVEKETPLLLLLRKYIRGAHLTGVFQPPWERMLDLHFQGAEGDVRLIVEIMGKLSNIVMVGADGQVMEAVKRIGSDVNRYRVTLPGKPYVLPPPQKKPAPTALDVDDWRALLDKADPSMPLADLVRRECAAMSGTLAREIAARATGTADMVVGPATATGLVAAIAELFAPLDGGAWSPSLARDEEGAVIAFAPYVLTQFDADEATVEPVAVLSQAMAAYFEARVTGDAYAAARRIVRGLVEDARGRIAGMARELARQAVAPADVEALREAGELLLAYQWQVRRGEREATLPDYQGESRTITLDPTLTPVENANAYFRRYDKAKRAADEVPVRQAEVEAQLAYLDQLATDLVLAESRPEIEAVRVALSEGGYLKEAVKRPKASPSGGPLRVEVPDSDHPERATFLILVGRNSRQNEEVTFGRASPDDLWLHARAVSGAHVIIKRAGRQTPAGVVQRAAELAAYYSQARGATEVAVDITERRHVNRLRGGGPGLVTYREEVTQHVVPRGPHDDDEGGL